MRVGVLLLLVLLLGAGVVALALLGSPFATDAPSRPSRQEVGVEVRPPPRLEGPTAALPGQGEIPRDEAHAPVGPAPSTPASIRVYGRLLGLDEESPQPATVLVRAMGGDWGASGLGEVRVPAARDGSFEVDVTSLLTDEASAFEVEGDHPDHIPVVVRRTVLAGTAAYEVDLALPRAAIVSGQVVAAGGGAIAEAAVGAFFVGARDVPEDERAADVTATDEDGRYRLRLGEIGTFVVVAVHPDYRPRGVGVTVAPGASLEVQPLALEVGARIVGTVRVGGTAALGTRVTASDSARGVRHRLGSGEITWISARPEHARTVATTDARGRYRLGGLRPGPWLVQVEGLVSSHLGPGHALVRTVDAPAQGVDFDLRGSRVTITVRREGNAALSAVMVQGEGGYHGYATDEAGRVSFLGRAGATYRVRVGVREHELRIPTDGSDVTLDVDLDPVPESSGRVVVRLSDLDGRAVARAAFAFFDLADSGRWAVRQWNLTAQEGRFTIPDPPAGRRILAVRAGGTWYGGDAHYLPTEVDVEVPAEGEVEVELEVRLGGRLRVVARDAQGKPLPAKARIVDLAEHRAIDVVFIGLTEHGMVVSEDALLASAPSFVEPALPPGRYRIDLSLAGFLPAARESEVRPGETAHVDLPLVRH